MKKILLPLLALFLSFNVAALAASGGGQGVAPVDLTVPIESIDLKVPVDVFTTQNSYVFESDLNHGGSYGKQYEAENEFEYAHRFQIKDNWYLHTGLAYDRFDFGNTDAPVPTHLQSFAGAIGIDYMHGKDLGAFLQIRPGIYTEEHIGLASFDCPILVARFWTLQPDRLYILTGAGYSFLRGGSGAFPIGGLVWVPSKKFRVEAVPPEPRAIYSVCKQLDLYLGGELEGGAFRTDHHDEFKGIPHVAKLSGTQVDYADYRVGGGLVWSPVDQVDLDFGAGYAIQRSFNFHRAGEYYRTDPAPFLRFELRAKF